MSLVPYQPSAVVVSRPRKPKRQSSRRSSLLSVNTVPNWNPQIRQMNFRLRYTNTQSGQNTYQILARNLLDLIFVATSSSAGYCLYDRFRIRSVDVYYGGTSPVAAYAAVKFFGAVGGIVGDLKIHSATSMGVTPLRIHAVPEKSSTLAAWQSYSGSPIVELELPLSAVVDIVIDYRVDDLASPQAVNYAVVGATTGQIYYRGLDGVAGPASYLGPFGPVLSG